MHHEFVLIVPSCRLRADPEPSLPSLWETDQQTSMIRHLDVPQPVDPGIEMGLPMPQDLPGEQQVRKADRSLFPGAGLFQEMDSVEHDEPASILQVYQASVPPIGMPPINHPRPAHLDLLEGLKVDLHGLHRMMRTVVCQSVQNGGIGTEFLFPKDNTIVIVIRAVLSVRQLLTIPPIMKEHRLILHEQTDRVFVRMTVVRLLRVHGKGVLEVVPLRNAEIRLRLIVEQKKSGSTIPSVAEDDLLPREFVQDVPTSAGGYLRRDAIVQPEIRGDGGLIHRNLGRTLPDRLEDPLGREHHLRIPVFPGRAGKAGHIERRTRLPVRVPEIGQRARRSQQLLEILEVVPRDRMVEEIRYLTRICIPDQRV